MTGQGDVAGRLVETAARALLDAADEALAHEASVIVRLNRGPAAVLAAVAPEIAAMCHWRCDPDSPLDASEQHMAFHFGRWPGQSGVCPYEAVAAVLSGEPDPRDLPEWVAR